MAQERYLVVGVGKEDERAALDWAAHEAMSRGCALELVSVYPHAQQIWAWQTPDERRITADLRELAQRRLGAAMQHLHSSWPELTVKDEAVMGISTDVLLKRSFGAELTVLGSRGRHAIGSALLGSVSGVVAAGASGSVVVVPAVALSGSGSEVVVGVDGFERTDEVLFFAFDYAERHGLTVHALYSWWDDNPSTLRWLERTAPERTKQWLADLLVLWQQRYPAVNVRQTVTEQPPTAALTAASQTQRLLVVGGHRSHHPRLITALGSVSQGTLHHAVVPVAVVHQRIPGDGAKPSRSTDAAAMASSDV